MLIFEGEFINGEKNGKGKEFNYVMDNKLKYEGEFLNGKKWNGKFYNKDKTKFTELINGKGFIKNYFYDDDSYIFEVEYLNGEKNGKGKEYFYDNNKSKYKLRFEGEYLNGERNGKGKEFDIGYRQFSPDIYSEYSKATYTITYFTLFIFSFKT